MVALTITRSVGDVGAVRGVAAFSQGSLRVFGRGQGWSVVVEGRVRADVDAGGSIALRLIDDSRETAHVAESVVLVVARAILERLDGWFHVHAGLVVDDDGATLIVGESGAGKTTTTLALAAAAGARLLTDDVVFVQVRDDVLRARGLLRPLHVGPQTLAMFPALRERLLPGFSSAGKAIVDVDPVDAGSDVVVSRLIFPSIHAGDTVADPLSSSSVMPLLLRSSAMVAWPGFPRADEHLQALGRLSALPARALRLGRDAHGDAGAIARALR
ncbi:MAG: hypothetical protein Q8O67_04335 [Deltaproteobacteria bacterium]|nr:hypothetical protein [Deltaproteobacteria bacterium]